LQWNEQSATPLTVGTHRPHHVGAGDHVQSGSLARRPPAERCRYASPPSEETVAPEVAASLTDALRAMYDTVVDEPLPDAFAQLLSRLDDSDA
jgi:hypothetical protein